MSITSINESESAAEPFSDKERSAKRLLLFIYAPLALLILIIAALAAAENRYVQSALSITFSFTIGFILFAWVLLDARQRGLPFSRPLRYSLVLLGFPALLYYFFRSRGIAGGARSAGWLLLYVAALVTATMVVATVATIILMIAGVIRLDAAV